MAEYRLTPAAEYDLEAIWTHTIQQWDVEQANRYTDFLMEALTKFGTITHDSSGL